MDTLGNEKVEQLQEDEMEEDEEQESPTNTDVAEASASFQTPDCIVVDKNLVKKEPE